MNEHKNHVGCLSNSIKNQTKTSKRHLIDLDLIPLDLITPLRKNLFSIIISGTIEPRHSLDYGNSTGTIILTITQCSWGIIDAKDT